MTRDSRRRPAIDRRTFLRIAGAAGVATALAGCSELDPTPDPETETETTTTGAETETTGTETGTDTPRPEFGTVVDMVEAGADPNGDESIVPVLEEVAGDDTLLQFPSGTYLMDDQWTFRNFTHFGVRGEDATIVPPDGYDGYMFAIGGPSGATDFYCENLTFDFTGPDTGARAMQAVVQDDLRVRDLSVTGRHQSDQNVFRFDVRSEDGSGVVERLRLPDGGTPGSRSVGCFVGPSSRGEIRFTDCSIVGFPNNGLYASSSQGPVIVEGGLYKNNDVANVRLSSAGSVARNVDVVVDTVRNRSRNQRGIWLRDPKGVLVENCSLTVEQSTGAAISINGGGGATVRNTDIEINTSHLALLVSSEGANMAESVVVEDVQITGTADGSRFRNAIECSRNDCEFRNCTVEQTGDGRQGIQISSDDCLIDGGSWVSAGYPIVVRMLAQTGEGPCSVRLMNLEELTATELGESGTRLMDTNSFDGLVGSLTGPYCIGPEITSEQGGSQEVVVAIHGIRRDGLFGQVISDEAYMN